MRSATTRRLRGHATLVALATCAAACSEQVIVAESSAGSGGEAPIDAGSGGRMGSGGGGGTSTGGLSSGGSQGSNRGPDLYDPCDSDGFVDFGKTLGFIDAWESEATGYVVSFDPPTLLGSRKLEENDLGDLTAKIDRLDLEGAPTCEELRGALVFAVVQTHWNDGVEFVGQRNARTLAPVTCDLISVTVDERVVPVDRVRAFGMFPGESQIDGPLPLSIVNAMDQHWSALPASELPGCGPGYLVMTVAHIGGYLAASFLTPL